MKFSFGICAALLCLGPANARDLNIVTDIAPVGALVAQLTDAEVTVLIQPGQSPHDVSLRPSQARALRDADVVVWMGAGLTPSLETALAQLAKGAEVVELLALSDIDYLPRREDAVFVADDGHDHDHDHGHDHDEDIDPHAWLDPKIAAQWLGPIAAALGAVDREGAGEYMVEAVRFEGELKRLEGSLREVVSLKREAGYFVSHDAFQYFEQAFAINVIGAVNASDGSSASVARLRDLQARASDGNATCLLTDSSVSGASMQKTADTLGLSVQSLDILSPSEGAGALKDGYVQILSDLALKIATCGSE